MNMEELLSPKVFTKLLNFFYYSFCLFFYLFYYIYSFFFFFFFDIMSLQDYFTYVELMVKQRWGKTRVPGKTI